MSDLNIPFDEDYWLELEINGQILDHHQKLNMVAYAAIADTASFAFSASCKSHFRIVSESGDSVRANDCIINISSSGSSILYLPTAVGITGKVYTFINSGDNPVVIDSYENELISLTFQWYLFAWDYIIIVSDGSNWLIIGRSP